MTKLLFNRRKLIEVEDSKILQGFANSHIIKDYSDHPEEVRLALFVAFDEPVGFGSTFRSSKEFYKLFDKWCAEKHKFSLSNGSELRKNEATTNKPIGGLNSLSAKRI